MIAEEAGMILRIRNALASGAASEALIYLDTFDTLFPNGGRRDEAAVLRVEALARHGEAREAEALARALWSRPLAPALVDRLRVACAAR
jgi:hypothetical protein